MAERKTNQNKKTVRLNKSKKPNSKNEKASKDSAINDEVVLIAVLGLTILLILCVFTDACGVFGQMVDKLMRGSFGVGAIILPFAVMLGSIFAGFKKFKETSMLKNILLGILFVAVISVFHTSFVSKTDAASSLTNDGLGKYIAYFFENGGSSNGGVLGAVFGGMMTNTIGVAGAYVILVTIIIICAVIITGRSIFDILAIAANKTASQAKLLHVKGKEKISKYREERDREPKTTPRQKLDIPIMNPESNFEKIKKRISGNNYDYKLDWKKTESEFEKLSFEEQAALVAENPELFGYVSEKGLPDFYYDAYKHADKNGKKIDTPIEKEEAEAHAEEDKNEDDEIIIYNANDEIIEEDDGEPPFDVNDEEKDEIKIHDFMAKDIKAPAVSEILESKSESGREAESLASGAVNNEFIEYIFPPIELLHVSENNVGKETKAYMLRNAQKLEDTLKSFGVVAKVVQINKGPTVTRYELSPNQGVKVSKIVGLADDIALSLASNGIRIEAPVPGKSVVGIEVPNKEQTPVYLREVLESPEFTNFESKVAFGVGKDIGGASIVADISKMPHLLIAGATGAGKSVCINTLIASILYKASPNEVKLILIDPKVVELSIYNGIPHLLIPVVTDPKKAAGALNWAVHEMINRYKLFSEEAVRDLKGYNNSKTENLEFDCILPNIVIIIDELSDLMMASPKEVEDAIMRLAQMARAAGIHLIIATQRPSVDVITGVIKANIPSRLAFAVSSGIDSRTILDMVGAEKLLGKGDMLFSPIGMSKPVRVQGAFISDKEVECIVNFIKEHKTTEYDEKMVEEITSAVKVGQGQAGASDEADDEFYEEAVEFLLTKEKASVSLLQRQFRIGYNRAARLMETLENNGVVGPEDGAKPRKVIMTWAEYNAAKSGVADGID